MAKNKKAAQGGLICSLLKESYQLFQCHRCAVFSTRPVQSPDSLQSRLPAGIAQVCPDITDSYPGFICERDTIFFVKTIPERMKIEIFHIFPVLSVTILTIIANVVIYQQGHDSV